MGRGAGKGMSMATLDSAYFICVTCARKRGGVWPRGHCATMHAGRCDLCGEWRSLANVGDWDWPDGVERGGRD